MIIIIIVTILDLVDVGGAKFIKIPVVSTAATPGVRRSKRKRIETLLPGEYVEYQHHWGLTPNQRLGPV